MSIRYRRGVVKSPVFNESIKTASDWFQVINLTILGIGLYISRPLCYYRRDSGYNGKDTSKYETDFTRTIELTRAQFAPPGDLVDISCDYAVSRYSLGAGYRALVSGDSKKARLFFQSRMRGTKYRLYSFVFLIISYVPIRHSFLLGLKKYYKMVSRW